MNTAIDPLSCSWNHFSVRSTLSFSTRVAALAAWVKARTASGLMPFDRRLTGAPVPWTTLRERDGEQREGLNFVSSDYLGLATHPQVKQAAQSAIARFGTHSAGTGALAGTHGGADELCAGLSRMTLLPHVGLQPSGWAAGYGALRAILRPGDTVLIDEQAGSGLLEGARNSTHRVHRYRHLDIEHLQRWLQRLRAKDPHGLILVATPTLFPIDGAAVDLVALRQVCHTFDALLLIDVAHDLGCTGPDGTGEAGLQGLAGQFDLVVGSLAKTFASTGGFIATARADLGDYLRAYSPAHAFSAMLSPGQIAAASKAVQITRSAEGAARRTALQRASSALRAALSQHRHHISGAPGPIVQIVVGNTRIARLATRLCAEEGILLTLLEPPVVHSGACALRLQLMAGHEPALFPDVAQKIATVLADVTRSSTRAATRGATLG